MNLDVFFAGWDVVKDRSKTLSADQEPEAGRGYTMYHGTLLANAKKIITNGFERSKDGLLGPGIYVSRNIKKAQCYPLQTDKNEKVVFKLKVRVGKVKKIDCDNHAFQKSWHQNGYDCAWVPPHSNISSIKSGREEDCVWDPKRIKVVDVACCVDQAKRHELRRLIRGNGSNKHKEASSKSECDVCHHDASERPHDIQNCWDCGRKICPFQDKHLCNRN
ncbi:grass carp reovirus (GCRV)-induced gene 2o [Misgurnus anguillicaudatus]|uniref:grass carp reovirus (GCRV)-induced gene 2o n=1 Tax=Misgurnus anguillicaudatus TaxID=75329 RepID=UPI002435DCBB|nr:grass carp reovirus (GCRV)-induced gene 2o [Misgurnus anguillicaudatus]